MSDVEHTELARLLHNIKVRAAISGYRRFVRFNTYSGLASGVDAPEKTCHSVRQPRQESLWMNYEPP